MQENNTRFIWVFQKLNYGLFYVDCIYSKFNYEDAYIGT